MLVKRFLDNPATHEADSAQSPISTMDHHVLHVHRDHRVPVSPTWPVRPDARSSSRAPSTAPRRWPASSTTRRTDGRAARQPRAERPDPQHGGLPLRQGHHAGRHRHRRPRHPRRRRGPGRARRPAGRAQGLSAPLGSHRAGRCRRHGGHADDRPAGQGRPRPHPGGEISPTTTKFSGPSHPVLAQLAPGERVLVAGGLKDDRPAQDRNQSRGGGGGRRRSGGGGQGAGRSQGGQRSRQQGGRSRGGNRSSGAAPKSGGHSAASFSSNRRGR